MAAPVTLNTNSSPQIQVIENKIPDKQPIFKLDISSESSKKDNSLNNKHSLDSAEEKKNASCLKAAKALEAELYARMLKNFYTDLYNEKEYEGGIGEEIINSQLMDIYADKIVSQKTSLLTQQLYKDMKKLEGLNE